MADKIPLKLEYDSQGNPISIAEFQKGDTIPFAMLNADISLDGGAITDGFKNILQIVDGGLITDTYPVDSASYDGGVIV